MKLVRFGSKGREKPGVVDDSGILYDLSSVVTDWKNQYLSSSYLNYLRSLDLKKFPVVNHEVRFGPCVSGTGKFICIGLNYADHAKETNANLPEEPIIFSKFTSAICGANDPIIIPEGSTKTDWEVELGVIIGDKARLVETNKALDYVAGYCVINDISEREYQLERSGQWTKGKSCEHFGPVGPYLVTKESVDDVQNLDLWLEVNGYRYQNGNTNTMVFNVAFLVSYLSQFFTLYPGDIISTGTPPGVGLGQKPAVFLKPGDQVHLGIEGLGEQKQYCISESEYRLLSDAN